MAIYRLEGINLYGRATWFKGQKTVSRLDVARQFATFHINGRVSRLLFLLPTNELVRELKTILCVFMSQSDIGLLVTVCGHCLNGGEAVLTCDPHVQQSFFDFQC